MSLTDNTVVEICDSRGKVSVEWAIPDYFSLPQKADTYCESPPFLLSGSTWRIKIYRNGRRCDQTAGWFGLYIRKTEDVNIKKLETVTLGIKNRDGTVYKSSTFKHNFGVLAHGWPKFMRSMTLLQLKEEITHQGILTIFCVVRFASDVELATRVPVVDNTDDLFNDFRSLFLSGQHSDVILRVNGREIRAHKMILQARSPVLNAMLEHDWKEKSNDVVHLTDCNPKTFHEFLLFMYTGKIENMALDNVIGLYSIADKYQVKELKQQCAEIMKGNLTMDIACDIIAVADRHQEEELKKSAKELLVRNIKTIIPTEKWKSFMAENSVLVVEILTTVFRESHS